MSNCTTEIERKFLIESFPTDLPLKEKSMVFQAYLSIDPDVRIRRKEVEGKDTAYFLTIKSNGDLVRREVEFPISREHFYALAEMVAQSFITKDFCIYQLPGGLELECSHVDKGLDTEFLYAEVEFPSVQDAEAFAPLPCFTADVTNDPYYKMKNYWKRTRTGGGDNHSKEIKIRYLSDNVDKLEYIGGKSDWIDLRAAETVELKAGEFRLIPLGVSMQLPVGYEAHIVPRSSTFKNFGVIQTNHMGVVDESYCGDNDQWHFPALAMRDTVIHAGERICQFRIVEHQPQLTFKVVDILGNVDRGGMGSTGKK